MSEMHGSEWMRTLDQIGDAVQRCLKLLDRYEERFHEWLTESGHEAQPRPVSRTPSAPEAEVMSARLQFAESEAAAVERQLAEQEAHWREWQQRFAAWRGSLQQPNPSALGQSSQS